MVPKKKVHSNDLRILVIRHYQNGDSLSEIAAKTLLSRSTVQYMVDKYKSTKCIDNLFGCDRKRKTRATKDRLIQRKLKLYRQKSASTVKIGTENELGILLHVDTIRKRTHHELDCLDELLIRSLTWTRSIEKNGLSSPRKCLKSQWIFGRMLFGPTSQNSTLSARTVKLWSGEQHVKNSIQTVQFLRSSMRWWFSYGLGLISPV